MARPLDRLRIAEARALGETLYVKNPSDWLTELWTGKNR
jgi:hypothetical protein